jgi:hypothetical protein
MRRLACALALASRAALVVHVSACDGGTHVYVGHVFEPARGCVEPGAAAIDVVSGDPPGECAPVCVLQALSDGGREVFVSKQCGPYPAQADVSGADPVCPRALAALARGDTCEADGGSAHPLPADAGAE